MADILSFKAPQKARRDERTGEKRPATVIIFPGVRYERLGQQEGGSKWLSPGWMAPFAPQTLPQG